MHLEQLISQYGIVAVLLGAMLEGDLTLILAGVVAHQGYFSHAEAIGAGALGAFIADCAWYAVGRWRGERFRAGRFYARVQGTIEKLTRKVGAWELLVCRFVYGTKNASMLFWGLHGLPVQRFVLIDALGCVLGSAVFATLGWLLGGSWEAVAGHVKNVERLLLIAAVLGVVIVIVVNRTARRQMHIEPADGEGTEG
jgi:membrane protein DedA with SNARE-associated domain